MARNKFNENIQFNGSTRIDKEQSIIHGCKILGNISANGRIYLSEAMKKALPLYEGSKIFIDHSDSPRSYRDYFGNIQNVNLQEDGIYGDIKFNPGHVCAEQLLFDAVNNPSNVGLSHAVTGKHSLKDGIQVVEEITKVHSVDLVVNPATTAGLFEQIEKEQMEITDIEGLKAAVMAVLETPDLDLAGMAKALCELSHPLLPQEPEAPAEDASEPAEEPAMEVKAEEAVEAVQENNEEIQPTELDTLKKENAELKAELEAFKLKEEKEAKKTAIQGLIKSNKIAPELITEDLMESLVSLKEEQAKKLIENLKPFVGNEKPTSRDWATNQPVEKMDAKTFASLLKNK